MSLCLRSGLAFALGLILICGSCTFGASGFRKRRARGKEQKKSDDLSPDAHSPRQAKGTSAGLSIGVGFDIANTDLWSMRNNYPLEFYSEDMPTSCFAEEPCSTSTVRQTYDFKSIKEWEQTFAASFGIEIGGGYKGFKGSISASIGVDFQNSWSNEKEVSWSYTSKTQKCYQLRSSCSTNPAYLSSRARNLLEQLPMDGTDKTTMDVWRIAVIKNFGSHIAVKSSHGALIQAASSVDKSCKMSSSCRNFEACLKLGFMEYVDLKMCGKQDECMKSKSCAETFRTECAAVGGNHAFASAVCGKEVSEQEINRFLESGDVDSASSTIGLTLKPLYEILMQMGFWRQGLQVQKATEYHSCSPPLGIWTPSGKSHECKCDLKCQNGGKLDPTSCSCTCPGDDNHGFTGGDCSATYGKCVRGIGSSGTPSARGRACVEGNYCAGIERSNHCANTDVCCNRDEGGLCCPFGSSCECFAVGQRFCKCKPGRNLWQ